MKHKHNKIAFIGPIPPPMGGVAMANMSFQELASELGLEVEIFNTASGSEREELYRKASLKDFTKGFKKFFSFLGFAFKMDAKVANVFVTSGFGFFRELLFILTLRLLGKKIIAHLHSKKSGEFFLAPSRIKIFGFFLNRCHSVIMLSEDHKTFFSQYIKLDKLTIIENFVDYAPYECAINEKKDEIVYVGRLSEKKGFFDLLKAIEVLKGTSFHLNVIGMAETEEVEKEVYRIYEENKLSEVMTFHGFKSGHDKHEIFKRSKIMLFPSHFENSPIVIKEGIAAKQAILCSDIFANKNILDKHDCKMYFKVADPQDQKACLQAAIESPANLLDLMQKSAEIKDYDRSVAKQKFAALITKIHPQSILN